MPAFVSGAVAVELAEVGLEGELGAAPYPESVLLGEVLAQATLRVRTRTSKPEEIVDRTKALLVIIE